MKALIIVLLSMFALNAKAEPIPFEHDTSIVCSAAAIVAHSKDLITKDMYRLYFLGFMHYYTGSLEAFGKETIFFAHSDLTNYTDKEILSLLGGCEYSWLAQREVDGEG